MTNDQYADQQKNWVTIYTRNDEKHETGTELIILK